MSILEAFLAGKEARRQADAAEQVNRMQSFLAQNGQAIFQGDSNALGQLAGMGPQGLETAMNLRTAQEQRAAAEAERARAGVIDQRQDQEWQWKVEQYAASKTAAEREAEAAKIEEAVKMGLAAKSPEEWDMLVTQAEAPNLVGMFDQREAVAQRFMTMAEILKRGEPADSAAEQKIQRIMETQNVDRATAVGIVDGVLQVSRDPLDQSIIVTNLATNTSTVPAAGQTPSGQPAPAPSIAPAQQPVTAPAAPPRLDFGPQFEAGPNVFGMEGFAKSVANTATDVIPGIGTAFPEEMRTQNDFNVLREQLVNDVASAYERQPPSWLLQNIQDLAPTPGKITEGPDAAASKLRSLGRALQQEMALVDQQLAMKVAPAQRQTLEARRSGLEMALSRISSAVQSIEPPKGGAKKTSSGITFEIIE